MELTKMQKELFPQMLGEFLQRNQANAIPAIIEKLSDASTLELYAMCEAQLMQIADVAEKQKKQLEDARGDKVL